MRLNPLVLVPLFLAPALFFKKKLVGEREREKSVTGLKFKWKVVACAPAFSLYYSRGKREPTPRLLGVY
jgi:hypothetical protein